MAAPYPSTQLIFWKVKEHLLAQMAHSRGAVFDNKMMCAYRGDAGRKCAIGCLIPDEMYDPTVEGCSLPHYWTHRQAWDIRQEKIVEMLESQFGDVDVRLLQQLQAIHDQDPVGTWKSKLQSFADFNGLQYDRPAEEM